MKWYRAELLASVQVGVDETHNPAYETLPTGKHVLVRVAPWSRSHVSTEGNGFDMVERTFLTKAPASSFDGISAIEMGGARYDIERVMIDGGQTAVRVRRCDKPWDSG